MHSSRTRTVCCSGRLGGCLPGGFYLVGVYPGWGGGVWPGRCLPRGCLSGWCVSQHALGQTPLWTEFLTRACENITFSQLLWRTVIILITVLLHVKRYVWNWWEVVFTTLNMSHVPIPENSSCLRMLVEKFTRPSCSEGRHWKQNQKQS